MYNQTAFEQDREFIKDFFRESEQDRKTKMQTRIKEWNDEKSTSFDGLWDEMKRDMLTKQEN